MKRRGESKRMDAINYLEKAHRIQLEIASETRRICEKHGIKYSLIAGTLLGAIRHKGFIPWDDDLDIGMLRPEYERFLKVAETELSGEYFLQTWDTDDEFGMPFAKIRKNGTVYIEKNSSKTNQHKGIYIDIFPFDVCPENKLSVMMHKTKTFIYKKALISKLGYEVWDDNRSLKHIVYMLIKLLSWPFSLGFIKKVFKREMCKYQNIDSGLVVAIGGSYGYDRETIRREWLDDLQLIEFENQKFLAPVGYDQYLTRLYGDYMVLPPEDKRYNRHNIIEVDFGEE